jgi:hypothetical protein
MSPFEYVIVLISIILGLGITTILTGVAEWIKHYRNSTLHAPYIIWIVIVFIMHIHEWWQCYSLKRIAAWHLPLFLFVVLYPINLYVLAHLLFPKQQDEPFDAKKFYYDRYPAFFICALIGVVLSVIHNLTLEGLHPNDQVVHFLLIAVLGTVLITKTKSAVVHFTIAALLFTTLVITLILTQDMLLISQ